MKLLFVFLSFIITSISAYDGLKMLNEIVDSMDRGLRYLNSQIGSLNLDTIIGTRMVEDQLQLSYGDHPKSEYLVEILKRIKKLQKDASLISNRSIPYLKLHEPNYYWKMKDIIKPGSWLIDKFNEEMLTVREPRYLSKLEEMDGGNSDYCISVLFRKNYPCRISNYCYKMMTSPNFHQYSLTHQVFFWLIAEKAGCFLYDSSFLLNHFTQNSCSRIFQESKRFENNGFPVDGRDLFMEQIAICSLRGFRKYFCKDSWLKEILNWQKSSGCWGLYILSKRDEKGLAGGCLAHQTAVALAALSQFTRFHLEQF